MWNWLTKPDETYSWAFGVRVILKALALFALANLLFALINPMPALGRLSLYNLVVPGRDRLPYGENPTESYNLNTFNVPAMFAAHDISQPKADDEYRVLLIGDSSVWGFLLEPNQTLSAYLNAMDLTHEDGREMVFYNLGYPIMSLTKDLLILDEALNYQPDAVLWLVTLESMPREKQLFPPLVQNNVERVRDLITRLDLDIDPDDSRFVESEFVERTIVGQRRELADLLRLQIYGFAWSATDIDHAWNGYEPLTRDFDTDVSWEGFDTPQAFTYDDFTDILALDVLAGGIALLEARDIPVTIVNEPIFISEGENSDLRYNFWYPRWIYDQYRDFMDEATTRNGWQYIDLWDIVAGDEFTDSPVHMTPMGTHQLADALADTP